MQDPSSSSSSSSVLLYSQGEHDDQFQQFAAGDHQAHQLKCPRCESSNTKFCYYNNYNLSQPRHYCKNCRRYWTKGGTLRNIPVGGASRKNNNNKSTTTTTRANTNRSSAAAATTTKPPPPLPPASVSSSTAATCKEDHHDYSNNMIDMINTTTDDHLQLVGTSLSRDLVVPAGRSRDFLLGVVDYGDTITTINGSASSTNCLQITTTNTKNNDDHSDVANLEMMSNDAAAAHEGLTFNATTWNTSSRSTAEGHDGRGGHDASANRWPDHLSIFTPPSNSSS